MGEAITEEGLLPRTGDKSYFTPENNTVSNEWFWRDVPGMMDYVKEEAARLGLEEQMGSLQGVMVDVIEREYGRTIETAAAMAMAMAKANAAAQFRAVLGWIKLLAGPNSPTIGEVPSALWQACQQRSALSRRAVWVCVLFTSSHQLYYTPADTPTGSEDPPAYLMQQDIPVGRPAHIELRNQHAQYAVIW